MYIFISYNLIHGHAIPEYIRKERCIINNYLNTYPILFEAYEHFKKTNDMHFEILPKNPDYLLNVLNSVQILQNDGYITNVSENLLNDNSIYLVPMESMSFDITLAGIEFVRDNTNC